jgi:DNA-binding transcriptional ArsR family regulator
MEDHEVGRSAPTDDSATAVDRREATVQETKALAHPLRLRILRLCWQRELTDKQLAERLDRDPGTVLYHVRQLLKAGLLEPAPVRAGESGALEKPYRAKARSWWMDDAPDSGAAAAFAPVEAFQDELRAAGPESVRIFLRYAVHLKAEDIAELERDIMALLDRYLTTDDGRLDEPAYGGLVVLHRLAD